MNMGTTQERPGVYSVYEASAVVSAGARNGVAAVAALSTAGTAGQVYELFSCGDTAAEFGAKDPLTELVCLLLVNGAAKVLAVPVRKKEDYAKAFDQLAYRDGIKVMTCDSTELTVQQALRDCVKTASEQRRERIAVVAGTAGQTVSQLTQQAKELNSERVVLIAPGSGKDVEGARTAAAAAGAICAETDPALPLGGVVLRGLPGIPTPYQESEIDTLIQGGVTPVESVAGVTTVVRGVTTRTLTSGTRDDTWKELTTILVVDDVIPGVRNVLRTRFSRSKNTPQTRDAIRSQVILELERKKTAEYITNYGEITVRPAEDKPTICLVEFSFTVAHGLNQIWLNAQIAV